MKRFLPLLALALVGCGQQASSNDKLYGEFFSAEKEASAGLAQLRRDYGSDPHFQAGDRRRARFLICMSSNRSKQTAFPVAVTACRIESEAGH